MKQATVCIRKPAWWTIVWSPSG